MGSNGTTHLNHHESLVGGESVGSILKGIPRGRVAGGPSTFALDALIESLHKILPPDQGMHLGGAYAATKDGIPVWSTSQADDLVEVDVHITLRRLKAEDHRHRKNLSQTT